jgi:hypothetical protein
MPDSGKKESIALMTDFAERTGLTGELPPKRYLWTDAFAVSNFIGLARATGEDRYLQLALRLIDQVHHTLGRHRADDSRSGWISGLSEQEGELHPTRGGLRIGKNLPERRQDQPFNEQLEWNRDGQYFHYLTKWMQALDLAARATGEPRFNRWGRELAKTAHKAFTYLPSPHSDTRRMYWKMSIDLTRALVPSMGQHDPLDGYITCVQLRSTAVKLPAPEKEPDLANEISQLAAMIEEGNWATADPLGIGGLLVDAHRVEQLPRQETMLNSQLLTSLLLAALTGLQSYARSGDLQMPAAYRLAFRELGLSIGLHAVERMWKHANQSAPHAFTDPDARAALQALMQYQPMRGEIESFWRDPVHQRTGAWSEHRDINEVMLATSLVPDGFLTLIPAR